jgi:hypothetical protein
VASVREKWVLKAKCNRVAVYRTNATWGTAMVYVITSTRQGWSSSCCPIALLKVG